ncbi:complement C1s subcomponent [Bufo gargarizans]|uniref:complement C1s subcomponent n=1 Tax=Bufo gargarizans TaxID=30331 RepID=UPI001CF5D93A|nr:complement C1s subcomponent [Bufo gargarizans]
MRWLLFLALLGRAGAGSPSMFGEITSPNYPEVYPNNAEKIWNILVPEGYGIRLYFTHLDIEPSENCEYDSLQVLIGDEVQQTFCGRHVLGSAGFPGEKFYPTSHMKLLFKSDFSNQERRTGFAAYYMAADVDECDTNDPCSHFCNNYIGGFFCSCPPEYELQEDQNTCGVNCSGGLYTDLRGQISSPGYPAPYPENSRCEYRILLESGYQVILTFKAQDFDIEVSDGGSCLYDSLTIKAKGQKFGPYCGKTPPPRIESGSNEVDIEFMTDSGGDNKGWKIYYSEDAIPCPTDVFHHAILNPRKDKYVFKDMITVKCEEGFEIVSKQTRLPSFRAKCQGDGTWSSTHLKCEPVNCGDPEQIVNGDVIFTHTTYGAKAVYNCITEYYTLKGDDTYYCSVDGLWINNNNKSDLPKCAPVCGKSSFSKGTRIFGGEKADDGFFPWLVRIFFPTQLGGGSLISDRWVLTAAHVLLGKEMPTLQVGAVDHTKATKILAKKVFIHPDWVNDDGERTNYNNDIALIQLPRRIELDECIYPICLPEKGQTEGPAIREVGYIAGWGQTNRKNRLGKTIDKPRILEYTGVSLRDLEDCKKAVPKKYDVTSNMLCAGEGGHDTCSGDSGGPLMFEDLKVRRNKRFYIAGIVSWGIECGDFGMYTKVQNYVDWIEKTIEEVEDKEKIEEQQEPQKICKKT